MKEVPGDPHEVFAEPLPPDGRAMPRFTPSVAPTQDFRGDLLDHLRYTCVTTLEDAKLSDMYRALAHSVRDRLVQRWLDTQRTYREHNAKRVYYLSSEFLTGRSLGLCLLNLGLYKEAQHWLGQLGYDLDEVLAQEDDPGLGNGGLGRLAACFMDSLATLAMPAVGYGIRYDYGIFEQRIEDGEQVEHPDAWLERGNPWELPRHELTRTIRLYGHVEQRPDADGQLRSHWTGGQLVLGVPYDSFIVGHEAENVNTLRLWAARAPRDFDLQRFNAGDYWNAVADKVDVENISKVLYPADHTPEGKALRLKSQYFFVACSLGDILRQFQERNLDFEQLPQRAAIQLNDTHPAIAVAELMRLLVDEAALEWDTAWRLTRATFGYTNHTLLPEALETWSVKLFEQLLPRHLEIIYEINHHFLREVAKRYPNDLERLRRLSLIEEGPEKKVRMAHLASLGSHSINGVAKLHSQLVTTDLLPDFFELYPERFNNKTNGITPRRWLLYANPKLCTLIQRLLGADALRGDLKQLQQLREHADDPQVQEQVQAIKRANKYALFTHVKNALNLSLDPGSMLVVQVKRIHEYKRQLLACLGIIARYLELREHPNRAFTPRTYLFAGKAAPNYHMAKRHIRLIHDVAQRINHDPLVQGRLKVAFLPNYGVSLAQAIIPAADISLQISLAGKEASGTGNMKLALNGALTLGTLDGANIEIREAVGESNFLDFGMTVAEAHQLERQGYNPSHYIERSATLRQTIEALEANLFCPNSPDSHRTVAEDLRHRDTFMTCADFDAYLAAEGQAAELYAQSNSFARMSLLNTAGASVFSSDDTIAEYASHVWGLQPVPVHARQA